jgi:hypothetical protein
VSFDTDGYDVLLKLAGRFPTPLLNLVEPEFVDLVPARWLFLRSQPGRRPKRRLQEFGLLEN